MATLDEIRKQSKELGVEFYFAQFVDMYARPSAKLIPAWNLDDFVENGAGFAGFAAGEIGQVPSDPDIAAIPDLDSFTPVPWQPNLARFACDITVEGEPWPYDPRTILRNALARAAEQGYEFKIGLELEYFLVRQARGRLDRGRRLVRHAREAVLRPDRPDAQLRVPDEGLEVRQRPRLGQLRERPRGRERAVRAELHLRGRARELRPGDLLPLHGAHAGRAGRRDRHVHAEAVHEPDRQRLPLPHVALEGRRERLPRRGRPARPGALGARLPLHRRPQAARPRLQLHHGAHGQLLQAAQGRDDRQRRHVVAGLDQLRLQQPDADAPHPRARPHRGPHDRRRLQPVSRGRRGARRRPRRRSTGGSIPASRTPRTSMRFPTTSFASVASRRCRRTSWWRPTSSSRTTCCGQRSAAAATRTTSTTSSGSSATSSAATTSRSPTGRSRST